MKMIKKKKDKMKEKMLQKIYFCGNFSKIFYNLLFQSKIFPAKPLMAYIVRLSSSDLAIRVRMKYFFWKGWGLTVGGIF